MFRAFLVDFDGTLLNASREVGKRSRDALWDLVEGGWAFVPVSSRPVDGLMFPELPPPRYVIALNGAVVVDRRTGGRRVLGAISPKTVRMISQVADDRAVLNVFTPDVWLASDTRAAKVLEEGRRVRFQPQVLRMGSVTEAAKCLLLGEPADLDEIEVLLSMRVRKNEAEWFRSEPDYLEVGPPGVSKGAAVQVLRQIVGRKSYCAAVGDGPSDVSLMEAADLRYAVDNATPEVKALAGWTAPANDDEGVADVAERLMRGLSEDSG